jgi:DNA-binding response OmpR family regulator
MNTRLKSRSSLLAEISIMFVNREILIVDSDFSALKALKNALIENGFIVHFAHDGDLALRLAIRHQPDLILCDASLPDMEGRELMERAHKEPEGAGIPFILLTPATDVNIKVAALEAGADDCMEKPIDETELIARIHVVLRRTAKTCRPTLKQDEAIRGKLVDLSLIDLAQLFHMGRKTAVIQVEGEQTEGQIYFEAGDLVHAVAGTRIGRDAILELFAIQDGTFFVHLHVGSKVRTIYDSPTKLIMELACRLDEAGGQPRVTSVKGPKASQLNRSPFSEGIKELFEKGVIEQFGKP